MSYPNINFMKVKVDDINILINLNLVQGVFPLGEQRSCIDFGDFGSVDGVQTDRVIVDTPFEEIKAMIEKLQGRNV